MSSVDAIARVERCTAHAERCRAAADADPRTHDFHAAQAILWDQLADQNRDLAAELFATELDDALTEIVTR